MFAPKKESEDNHLLLRKISMVAGTVFIVVFAIGGIKNRPLFGWIVTIALGIGYIFLLYLAYRYKNPEIRAVCLTFPLAVVVGIIGILVVPIMLVDIVFVFMVLISGLLYMGTQIFLTLKTPTRNE
ncbi:MAG: hypothetical protein ACFFC7_06845 [Candidatus Hermodarchaeota archaeon]